MAHCLVIVESPSKAKTLKKYLGHNFEVLASYGHVRDLEAKEGAVDPEQEFRMKYAVVERNRKHVDAIARAAEQADQILLATDPDREGEAIAWHLSEIIRGRKNLRSRPLKRVVFYEITEAAVKEGVSNPRDISMPLVNAQQARRALDHLVGFNLSPLLWRKIGPSLSAGRVQSPALRLIVERELEIEAFTAQEYWSIHLDTHKGADAFTARLTQHRGRKMEQFSVTNAAQHEELVAALVRAAGSTVKVARVEKKPKSRSPAAPFITSTLQQEAVRKLGMSADRAMRTAQQLYEGVDIDGGTVGLITYMRTDSTSLAGEAVREIRDYVAKSFDAPYLPKAPVEYKSTSKNAQEAHEAIRPTSIFRTPDQLRRHLTPEQARLYEMIWKRTLACQMAPARYDTTGVDIQVGTEETYFRATGQTLVFPGFIAVYQEGADDVAEEGDSRLPQLEEGESLPVDRIFGEQHFTLPPPRYTEASLVKRLEEYGIGRPSTYANIISTLLDRQYAVPEKKRLVPTDLGRLVNGFLTAHFGRYVDYAFTAEMEQELDQISNGELDWVKVLREFWGPFVDTLEQKGETGRGVPLPAAEPPASNWKDFAQRVLSQDWQAAGRPPEPCPKCGSIVRLQRLSEVRLHAPMGRAAGGRRQSGHRPGQRPRGAVDEGPVRLLRSARRGAGRGQTQARQVAAGVGDAPRSDPGSARACAAAAVPAPAAGLAPADQQAGRSQHRAVRPVRQIRWSVQVHPQERQCVRHRPGARAGTAGAAEDGARGHRAPARPAPDRSQAGCRPRRALRTLRQAWQRQRHRAVRHGRGHADAGRRRGSARREGGERARQDRQHGWASARSARPGKACAEPGAAARTPGHATAGRRGPGPACIAAAGLRPARSGPSASVEGQQEPADGRRQAWRRWWWCTAGREGGASAPAGLNRQSDLER
jgi:DNA topoisomerase I